MFVCFSALLFAYLQGRVEKHGCCLGHSGDGSEATNNVFNFGKFFTLWNVFCDASIHRRETDVKIISLDIYQYNIAKAINFSDVIDEYKSFE